MSDFAEGKYHIFPAGHWAPPPLPVGANPEGPVSPVVIGGKDNIWTVRKLEDQNYSLTLETSGGRWLSKAIGDNVVVEIMPLPGQWAIRKQENDSYSIEVPSPIIPSRAWTIQSSQPGTEVKLGIYELPRPGQLWHFKLVPE